MPARYFIRLAAVALLLLAGFGRTLVAQTGAAGELEAAEVLIGTWEAMVRTTGGIGWTYEFRTDATMTASVGAMLDFNYRVDGDRVIVSPIDVPGDEAESLEFRLEEGILVQDSDAETAAPRFQRFATPQSTTSALLGKWRLETLPAPDPSLSPEQQQAMEAQSRNQTLVFNDRGRMLLRIPLATHSGRYTVEGNRVSGQLGSGSFDATFTVAGDVLSLTTQDGSGEQQFRRTESYTAVPESSP